jgi:hypothetical protein
MPPWAGAPPGFSQRGPLSSPQKRAATLCSTSARSRARPRPRPLPRSVPLDLLPPLPGACVPQVVDYTSQDLAALYSAPDKQFDIAIEA